MECKSHVLFSQSVRIVRKTLLNSRCSFSGVYPSSKISLEVTIQVPNRYLFCAIGLTTFYEGKQLFYLQAAKLLIAL